MAGVPYWIVPIFSSLVWLGLLLGMLLTWVVDHKPHLASMDAGQTVPFISDIGAWKLKPVFIAMSAVTVVSFDLAFILERWFRHLGKLTPNTSWWQKTWSLISILGAIVGAAGLILLSIFDTLRHPSLHDVFLGVFILGYVVSAIFICAEYQRLGIHYREHRILRISFWVKLAFILLEVGLAIAFGVTLHNGNNNSNTAGVIEWVVALVYAFYVMSFYLDFLPVQKRNKEGHSMTSEEMAMRESAGGYDHRASYNGGPLPYQQQPGTAYTTQYPQRNAAYV